MRVSALACVVALFILLSAIAASQSTSIKRVPARYTSAASGQEMYVSYCASCHGRDGRGQGPAAPALRSAPPDLTTLARRNNGKLPADHVYSVLVGKSELSAHGSADMPVWGPIFRRLGHGSVGEEHLRATNLTKYLESIQTK